MATIYNYTASMHIPASRDAWQDRVIIIMIQKNTINEHEHFYDK